MKITGFAALIATTIALTATPAWAADPERAAWTAVQQINEMAEEARARCAAGQQQSCTETAAITGTSFGLVRDAKRCASGRYPITCGKLQVTIGEIDALYARYLEDVGPERVAANKSRLQCRVNPMFGCDSGVVQASQ